MKSLHKTRRGFTLIELLVVVSVLGILMAVLLPRIFSTSEATNLFACKKNLQNLYQMLTSYKQGNHGLWPRQSGVRLVLAVTHEPAIYEPTEQNVGLFFCPSVKGQVYGEAVADPLKWYCPSGKSLDQATAEDSDYAGRDMKRFGKGVGVSNLEPLVCDDNEFGSNHKGSMNVLFAGGQVQDFKYKKWLDEGLIGMDEEELNVSIGPDSQIKTKRCDLTKMKVD